MAGPLPAVRFNWQPQYPAGLDRNHPLGKLVTAAVAAHVNGGRTELVSGQIGSIAGAKPTVGPTAGGIGAAPSTSGSGYYWNTSPNFCDASADFSLEFLLYYNGGAVAQYDRIWDFGAGGSGSGGWDLEAQSSSGDFNFVPWNSGTPAVIGVMPAPARGRTYHLVVTRQGTSINAYVNGVLYVSTTAGISTAFHATTQYGSFTTAGSNSAVGINTVFALFYHGTVLTPGQVKDRYSRQWGIFQPARQFYFLPSVSAGGGVTGTAAWTEAQDTWSGTGGVLVSGTAAWTEAKDTWAGTGGIYATGTVAWTEGNDSWSASGAVTTGPTASVAWTEAQDSWAGTGGVLISGTVAWTGAQDTWAVTGSITLPGVTGTVAWTEGPDLWAVAGSNGLIWTPVTVTSTIWTPQIPGSSPWTPVG